MSRYKKYLVEFQVGDKKFRGVVTAFNEDDVRRKIRNKVVITLIQEQVDNPFSDIFKEFFG